MLRVVPAVAAVLVMAGCGPSQVVDGPPSESSVPPPPGGSRWVGSGQVVVAVPEWWTTGQTQCFEPVEDTVYFDSGVTKDCVDPPPRSVVTEVSALAVLDAGHGYGEQILGEMKPVSVVEDRDILELDSCEAWFDGVCRRLFAVPSEDVVFAVTIAEKGDGDYESIRDSLRVLPFGWTTVPLATRGGQTPTWGAEPRVVDDLVTRLREAELRVEIETVERPSGDAGVTQATLPAGSLLEVSPGLGSVIKLGGTVTLSVAGESMAPAP